MCIKEFRGNYCQKKIQCNSPQGKMRCDPESAIAKPSQRVSFLWIEVVSRSIVLLCVHCRMHVKYIDSKKKLEKKVVKSFEEILNLCNKGESLPEDQHVLYIE